MNPRRLAHQIIKERERSREFVDELLEARAPAGLSKVDRAFLTNLVYGVTRHRRTLEYLLEKLSGSELKRIQPEVALAIEIGLYQLIFLERVPEYAAVNEAVEMAKEISPRSGGFANAILRKLLRSIQSKGKGPDDRDEYARTLEVWGGRQVTFAENIFPEEPVAQLEVRFSYPQWMVKRWVQHYGYNRALEICRAGNQPPPLAVRVNLRRIKPVELIKRLSKEGVKAHPGVVECSLHLVGAGKLTDLKAYKEGLFQVQDESAMMVATALGAQPGERILDLCSAPGGKSTHIAELAPGATVISCDVSFDKNLLLKQSAERMKLSNVRVMVGDARRLNLKETFHGVLLDAPCSNTGVLSRRPDARWRVAQSDLKKLPEMQLAMLQNAAQFVREGGRLAYSTCSIEPEENEHVVQKFLQQNQEFFLADTKLILPSLRWGGGFYAKMIRKAP